MEHADRRLMKKSYLWEPILKEAYIMEETDLVTIIEQVPQEDANIKAILNQIGRTRFGNNFYKN